MYQKYLCRRYTSMCIRNIWQRKKYIWKKKGFSMKTTLWLSDEEQQSNQWFVILYTLLLVAVIVQLLLRFKQHLQLRWQKHSVRQLDFYRFLSKIFRNGQVYSDWVNWIPQTTTTVWPTSNKFRFKLKNEEKEMTKFLSFYDYLFHFLSTQ